MLGASISYRYPTLSVQEVPLSRAEECGKAFIQLRHSAVGKEETPHMLRAQIMHSFLHPCSNHTPDTSKNAATLQLKAGATELSQTKALFNFV